MDSLPERMSEYYIYLQCLKRPEEDTRSPGTRVIGSCELLCWCWVLNLGTPQEEYVLLIREPSL